MLVEMDYADEVYLRIKNGDVNNVIENFVQRFKFRRTKEYLVIIAKDPLEIKDIFSLLENQGAEFISAGGKLMELYQKPDFIFFRRRSNRHDKDGNFLGYE